SAPASTAPKPGSVGGLSLTLSVGVLLSTVLTAGPARAGGYDTPMLYSARHMGMGGTAIGYVNDPSALFHNPAGLANVNRFAALGDFSLLLARVRSTPNPATPTARDLQSNQTVAPMFLLGAAHRLTDWLVAGLGLYPIASAGATYEYDFFGTQLEDTTRLVFLEASPALAANFLSNRLRIGLGYRLTYVSLERFLGDPTKDHGGLDFKLTGLNAAGFRVGAQYTIVDGISVGAVYRHKTETTVKNDTGYALSEQFADVSTEFVLASKLGAGVRGDFGDLGIGLDLEYLFNSQNKGYPLKGTRLMTEPGQPAMPLEVANVFEWKDEFTIRTGLEYRLLGDPALRPLALRIGYVFDGETTNPVYPSAFGTPPGPTHVITGGAGWKLSRWQFNLAYARRFGEGDVTVADLMTPGRRTCTFCGAAGDKPYKIGVHGFYFDVSVALD
ncbi:MAG TPA: outer membrane protein transport protein, partial [Polyangia bacterium]